VKDCVPNSVSVLGVPVSIFTDYDDALDLIRQRILLRLPTFCVAVNPEKVYRAKQDPKLFDLLQSAHIRVCDGIGISVASMLLYSQHIPRCTGIDLFLRVVHLSAEEGYKVFLLGASPEVNAAGCRGLVRNHPGLRIAGCHHGFFNDSAAIVKKINDSGADLLFVAMGSPRQEYWIGEHMRNLKTRFCMGIGGSLDVVSGSVKRAPELFRKTGTEWLFRLLSQPSRLNRQRVLPLFTWNILKEMGRTRLRTRLQSSG
jgi:N-acetylglucosaminyldiphosphoundecaprenol N-acetyl-beta-D-mannosaminyltransferase